MTPYPANPTLGGDIDKANRASRGRPPTAAVETLHAYAWGLDQNDLESAISCYSDDAEVRVTVDPTGEDRGTFVGKDAIRAMYMPSRRSMEPGEQRRHFVTNVTVEAADEASVTLRSYFLVTRAKGTSIAILTTGWYRFLMVDGGDAMRISRAEIHVDAGFATLVDDEETN